MTFNDLLIGTDSPSGPRAMTSNVYLFLKSPETKKPSKKDLGWSENSREHINVASEADARSSSIPILKTMKTTTTNN